MRVLQRSGPGSDGRIILNPVNLPAILLNSKRGGATGVLVSDALVISTIPCTSHGDTGAAAGIAIDRPNENDFDFELWFFEFWNEDTPENYQSCPVAVEELAALEGWLGRHPKIRAAYGELDPVIEIHLKDEWAQKVRLFRNGELETPDDVQIPDAEEDQSFPRPLAL